MAVEERFSGISDKRVRARLIGFAIAGLFMVAVLVLWLISSSAALVEVAFVVGAVASLIVALLVVGVRTSRRHHVRIGVQREGHRSVPQTVTDHPDVDARGEQMAGVRMPQVVKANPRPHHLRLLSLHLRRRGDEPVEGSCDPVRVPRFACRHREHESGVVPSLAHHQPLFPLSLHERPQDRRCALVDIDHSPRTPRLDIAGYWLARDHHSFLTTETVLVAKSTVNPTESRQFTAPGTTHRRPPASHEG